MKTKENFELRQVSNKLFVLEATGDMKDLFTKMITFNVTAAFLWNSVAGKSFSASDLALLLRKKFLISRDIALQDAESLVDAWLKAGIIVYD